MKKGLLFSLQEALEMLKTVEGKPKFHYAVIKNSKVIAPEVEVLQEFRQSLQVEGWEEFQKAERELIEKWAKKDEEGNPIAINNVSYEIPKENKDILLKEQEELNTQYKEVVDQYLKNSESFQEVLNEEIELEFYKMDVELLPESTPQLSQVCELFLDVGILE
jgi:hypothetical protein